MLRFSFIPYRLVFREPAGTSRGVLTTKLTFFLRVTDTESPREGFGEVPFFQGLSPESEEEVTALLKTLCENPDFVTDEQVKNCSCIQFGLESALADMEHGGRGLLFPSSFTDNESAIVINGLIWMGPPEIMLRRIQDKIRQGFGCIKLKIGAVNWQDELELIRYIRNTRGSDITIRVDANGAFTEEECKRVLENLAALGVHSIEQPLPKGNIEAVHRVCASSPVPVALDEELIGVPIGDERKELLEYVRPQYLILKPALCYGFSGTANWIDLARQLGIGWWITSALESNVGLNAIAQFTGQLQPALPQGLGTGNLFTNNLPSTLSLQGQNLRFGNDPQAYLSNLKSLFPN